VARPRVFVSSTYYDLKHLRSSLENFVESLGFDAILSEKGKIAYTPDLPLDESCYREVGTADIFVLIVGGRYGTEASATKTTIPKAFYDRYNSITRGEYRSAVVREVPTYVLIERSVYAEYETYLKNKSNKGIAYAHVDSVNIFQLIENIIGQPRNNPIQQFEKYSEIEIWLREQWAGLFRELLQRLQSQAQISSLQAQVAQLSEINTTLKRYLEEIVSRIAPKQSRNLIKAETERLADATVQRAFSRNPLVEYLKQSFPLSEEVIRSAASDAISLEDFVAKLSAEVTSEVAQRIKDSLLEDSRKPAERDLNILREVMGKPPVRSPQPTPPEDLHRGRNKTKRKTSQRRKSAPKSELEAPEPRQTSKTE
jgi:hypothetical protein